MHQKNLIKRLKVAEMLDVSKSTVDRLSKSADFPKPIKIGRSVFFVLDEVNAYIEQSRKI